MTRETGPAWQVHSEILQLISEFAWRLDHADGEGAAALFTEQGRLVSIAFPFDGSRDEICEGRENLAARWNRHVDRTTRHLFLNTRLWAGEGGDLQGTSSVIAFHHRGEGRPSTSEVYLVSDWHDRFAQGADGQWRFVERRIVPVFWGKASFPHLFQ